MTCPEKSKRENSRAATDAVVKAMVFEEEGLIRDGLGENMCSVARRGEVSYASLETQGALLEYISLHIILKEVSERIASLESLP